MPRPSVTFKSITNCKNKNFWIPWGNSVSLRPDVDGKKLEEDSNSIKFEGKEDCTLIEIDKENYLIVKNANGDVNKIKELEKNMKFVQYIPLKYLKITSSTKACKFLPRENGYLNFFYDRITGQPKINDDDGNIILDTIKTAISQGRKG